MHYFIHLFCFSLHLFCFIQVGCLYLLYGIKQLLIGFMSGFSFAVDFFSALLFSVAGFLVAKSLISRLFQLLVTNRLLSFLVLCLLGQILFWFGCQVTAATCTSFPGVCGFWPGKKWQTRALSP